MSWFGLPPVMETAVLLAAVFNRHTNHEAGPVGSDGSFQVTLDTGVVLRVAVTEEPRP